MEGPTSSSALGFMTPRQKVVVGGMLTLIGGGLMLDTLVTCPTTVCRATVSGLAGAGIAALGIFGMVINYYHMQSDVDSPASVRE